PSGCGRRSTAGTASSRPSTRCTTGPTSPTRRRTRPCGRSRPRGRPVRHRSRGCPSTSAARWCCTGSGRPSGTTPSTRCCAAGPGGTGTAPPAPRTSPPTSNSRPRTTTSAPSGRTGSTGRGNRRGPDGGRTHRGPCPAGRAGQGPWSDSRGASDVDAEVLGDAHEAGGVALADGTELPLGAVAVQLAEDHGGLGGRVLGQVVAGQLFAVAAVHDTDVGVAHLAEGLLAGGGVVDRDGEEDALDVRRGACQVDVDDLVVAFALTGAVVAGVLDAAFGGLQVVEEHEVLIGDDLLVRAGGDRAGVQVEVGAGGGPNVPAEADGNGSQVRRRLGQRHIAALGQTDTHAGIPFISPSVIPACPNRRVRPTTVVGFAELA